MTELNNALQQLKTTVSSINEKVAQGKQQANEYKQNIIQRLTQVVEQLRAVQNNPNLKNIPNLQGQLTESNNALQQKTSELADARKQLEQSNAQIETLNRQNAELTQQLSQKDGELKQKEEQLRQLQAANDENAAKLNEQIKGLQAEIDQLKQQKNAVEQQLAASNQELANLVRQIAEINEELNRNVSLINDIAASLGSVDSPEMAGQFESIAQNIAAIVKMINGEQGSSGPPPPSPPPLPPSNSPSPIVQQYNALPQAKKDALPPNIRAEIEVLIKNRPSKWETKMRNILANQSVTLTGGRRQKRKTRKIRKSNLLKGRKLLVGGYVYTTSKELDKSSSVISNRTRSSSPNTRSNSSNTSSNNDTPDSIFKRKTRKTTFRKRRTTRKHRHNLRK